MVNGDNVYLDLNLGNSLQPMVDLANEMSAGRKNEDERMSAFLHLLDSSPKEVSGFEVRSTKCGIYHLYYKDESDFVGRVYRLKVKEKCALGRFLDVDFNKVIFSAWVKGKRSVENVEKGDVVQLYVLTERGVKDEEILKNLP